MTLLARARSFVIALLRRRRVERDMEEEWQFQLESRVDDLVATGMTEVDAIRRARTEFGDTLRWREEGREALGLQLLQDLGTDVRDALRQMRRARGSMVLVVLTLALGIGATTAVFTIVDEAIWRSAPFAEANRLVEVVAWNRERGGGGSNLSPAEIAGWQAQSTFERLEGFAGAGFDVTGEGEAERISGRIVTTGLFPLLGVLPEHGRGFAATDGRVGSEPIVLISDGFWHSRFGSDPDVLGRLITLNEQPYRIIGVMRPRFQLLGGTESVWLPFDATEPMAGLTSNFLGIGRLRVGDTVAGAQAHADAIADHLQAVTPIAFTWGLKLLPLAAVPIDPDARTALLVMLGAVGCVLLIANANTANILLVRTTRRAREFALRSALGASRARLVRAALVESVMLSVIGGGLGIVFAVWSLDAARTAAPASMPFLAGPLIHIDARVLVFALTMTLVTGALCGLLPAVRGSRMDPGTWLRAGQGTVSPGGTRWPNTLVVVEVATAFILLTGATLMIRTVAMLNAVNPGFDMRRIVTSDIELPTDRYPNAVARSEFFDRLTQTLRGTPGILDATFASGPLPGTGGFSWGIQAEGSSRSGDDETVVGNCRVGPGYFDAFRIPVREGRPLSPRDVDGVVVSRSFAHDFWPGESAIGRHLRWDAQSPWLTIVGVVDDVFVQVGAGRQINETVNRRVMYTPYVMSPTSAPTAPAARRTYVGRTIIVRGSDAADTTRALAARLHDLDPRQPLERVASADDLYGAQFDRQRFLRWLLNVFSGVASALTAAGIFGVLAQTVVERTREIGIRSTLGATRWNLVRVVLQQATVFTAIGIALGIGGAMAVTRYLQGMLFGLTPLDPAAFAAAVLTFVFIAALATFVPARRATAVDPLVALRCE